MLIGYSRISTAEQKLDMQTDALLKAGCEKIFEEQASGTKVDRPKLNEALEYARSGDTLVVWRLDRLARSIKQLIHTVEDLERRNVGLKSLGESIDTTTATGKLIFHLFSAIAEFERNLTLERSRAGVLAAKARGRYAGRPRMASDKVLHMEALIDGGIGLEKSASMAGISKSTAWRIRRFKRPATTASETF